MLFVVQVWKLHEFEEGAINCFIVSYWGRKLGHERIVHPWILNLNRALKRSRGGSKIRFDQPIFHFFLNSANIQNATCMSTFYTLNTCKLTRLSFEFWKNLEIQISLFNIFLHNLNIFICNEQLKNWHCNPVCSFVCNQRVYYSKR